ncbi:protein THEM6-like [Rhineura floridana]|uniref:protein THEM6-like n=1 Tax=Rhineura floridana TaxID=261503 RepID=UPI002AC88D5C|nr:protein THEM6-like [Rhineura floridana]
MPWLVLAVALGALATFFAFMDGWYLLRLPLPLLYTRWALPPIRHLLEEQSFPSWVLPGDLDCLLPMNNARYPQEADLARAVHLTRSGLFCAVLATASCLSLCSLCCLHLLERFAIHTRLLGWDRHAFLLEQRFVHARDGFICAILHVWQYVAGASSMEPVECLYCRKVESPDLPEEVLLWLKYNEVSTQRLGAESDFQEDNKDE